MSEPIEQRLSRFTPDAASLDRDALLFAAGRASVRPTRCWQALVGILAASQLLTLVCLWPQTPPNFPSFGALTQPRSPAASDSPRNSTPPDEMAPALPQGWTPRPRLLSLDLDTPEPSSEEPMIPPDPPLRAFGPPPASILN